MDVDCDCVEEFDGVAPGVLFTAGGVQRCDICERFDGDLDAAAAVAALFDGEVWFYPDGAPAVAGTGQPEPVRWDGSDSAVIAEGTDPWVMVAGRDARDQVLAAAPHDTPTLRRIANTLAADGTGRSAEDAVTAARLLAAT